MLQTLFGQNDDDELHANRITIRDLCKSAVPPCPLFDYFVANYLAMPSTSCDVERMFGWCARQFDGRESLDINRLEAEVRVVDFVLDFVHSECETKEDFGQACEKIAERVWYSRQIQKNKK